MRIVTLSLGAGCDGRHGRQVVDPLDQFTWAKRPWRTAKSCGPGAATVASIPAGPCWRGNGDKNRRSPGRARISRKAIARGKPGCPGCTCGSTRVLFPTGLFAHGTAGAVGARLSLRPLDGERDNEMAQPGKIGPRE